MRKKEPSGTELNLVHVANMGSVGRWVHASQSSCSEWPVIDHSKKACMVGALIGGECGVGALLDYDRLLTFPPLNAAHLGDIGLVFLYNIRCQFVFLCIRPLVSVVDSEKGKMWE